MGDCSLRRYHPDDAAAVWDLHVTALSAEGAYEEAFAHRDADLERVVEEYLGTNGEFLVVTHGDEDLVAMGGFQPDGEDDAAAVIRRMRVRPDRQREGLGSWVLEELESRADEAGFDRLTLDTSTEMQPAMAFYEAHGYDEVDREYVAAADTTLVFYEKVLD
jgi:ribosomal protein S18 acetylase RimI-like enzyme